MAVEKPCAEYIRMLERWTRCRDCSDGQDAVHAAGPTYLPMLKEQTSADYAAYCMRATFYNATWRTIAVLVGMLFRKPPKVEVPESIKDYLDDVTMAGTPLHLFVQDVSEEALKLGRVGILVDYPTVDAASMTQADAQAQNLRPTMQIYRAESILNWRTGRVNNKTVLTMVVLKEFASLPGDNEFEEKSEARYRVLDLVENKYRVRMFRVKQATAGGTGVDEQIGGDLYPLMNNKPLDYIPFVFMGTDDVTPEVDDPPLIDLVNVNLAHYRSTADYEHGCHFTGLPTLFLAGFRKDTDGDKAYIGSEKGIIAGDPQAKASFVEFTGQGLGALEKNLAAKEQQLAVLGARALEPQKKAVEAADSASIRRKGEESVLSSTAQAISLGVEIALSWFVDWAGGDSDQVEFDLNREFYDQMMSPQMLTALMAAWQSGGISEQVLFDKLQQAEIIDQDTTLEEEQARKANGPPSLQGQPVGPDGKPVAPAPLEKPGSVTHVTNIHLPKSGKRTITNTKTGHQYTSEEAA